MAIRPGLMRTPMTLRKPGATTRSSTGEPTRTYTDAGVVWVEVIDQRGREFQAARQVNQGLFAMFRMHYQSDIDSTWQGVIDSDTYNFTSVIDPAMEHSALIIEAEKAG